MPRTKYPRGEPKKKRKRKAPFTKKKRFSPRFRYKPNPQMLEREKRARDAAYKVIQKQERKAGNDLTLAEIRKIYREQGLVEVLYKRPKKYARKRFISISPGKFRYVPEGRPLNEINAEGPVRDFRYLQRVIRMQQYWQMINVFSQEYRIPIVEARDRVRMAKEKGISVRFFTGILSGEYPLKAEYIRQILGDRGETQPPKKRKRKR